MRRILIAAGVLLLVWGASCVTRWSGDIVQSTAGKLEVYHDLASQP